MIMAPRITTTDPVPTEGERALAVYEAPASDGLDHAGLLGVARTRLRVVTAEVL